jgi:small subunit ribosomal protein S6
MRVYEELFIVKPDAPEEEVDAYIGQLKELITNGKGTVEKADKWGTRKLAYRVQKYNEGVYVLFQFTSSPELVKEVERRMRVTDMVIKFITVRIDEKTKKIEKRKKQRDKRAARKPAPPPMASPMQPAAGPSSPAAPAMPAGPSSPAAPAMPVPAAPAVAGPPAAAPGVPEAGAVAAVAETKES